MSAAPVIAPLTTRCAITDPTEVAVARRAAGRIATELRLTEEEVERARLVATELATNVLEHGGGGELLLQPAPMVAGQIECVALDRGRGIGETKAAIQDGFSTAGTLGIGLGSIRRAADTFHIDSGARGTIVAARVGAPMARARPRDAIEAGWVLLPHPGEDVSGDALGLRLRGATESAAFEGWVVDGLGHGVLAAEASETAMGWWSGAPELELPRALDALDEALQPTRGAAVQICRQEGDQLSFAGIGNVCSQWFDGARWRRVSSVPGVVGAQPRRSARLHHTPWTGRSVLVMYSDGVVSRLDLDARAASLHPSLLAAWLYREHARGSDDLSILVVSASGA